MTKLKSKCTLVASSLKAYFKTDMGLFLLIALAWQISLTIIGTMLTQDQGLLSHTLRWDAGWYQHIISQAYGLDGNPAAPAFYPLFPTLVALLTSVSLGLIPIELSALMINTVALWLILVAFWRIFANFNISKIGKILAITIFLSFPSAFFLHVFYSEAIFIALASWSYLFALQRKWWAVGVLLAILTASRLPSLLFIGLCGLEYLRSYNWNIKNALNKNALWFLLAPIGFISYGLYLTIIRSDFLAMFHAYDATNDWVYQVFNPNILSTFVNSFAKILNTGFNYEIFINYALPLLSIILILASSIYVLTALKSKGIPLFVFGLISVVLFMLNSNVVSVHRYALACIVLYVAIGLFVRKGWRALVVTGACLLFLCIQLFIYSKFTQSIFAG